MNCLTLGARPRDFNLPCAIINLLSKTDKTFDELLLGCGLRRTPVRLGVLDALAQARQPLSAQQILEHLPHGTDNVTLYRTLNTLTQKKLLHRVRGDDRVWRYGVGDRASHHEHAHFVCDECGTVQCLDDSPVPDSTTKKSGLGPGYRVEYSEVLVHGTCPDCRH